MTKLNASYAKYVKNGNIEALLSSVRAHALRQSSSDDVAQCVCLKVWQAIDSYDPERGSFAAWLSKITRNCKVNEQRSNSALVNVEPVVLESMIASKPLEKSTPDRVREVIADRTDPDLVQLMLSGIAITSAAKRLGLTQSQVIHRFRRIRKNICEQRQKHTSPERIT